MNGVGQQQTRHQGPGASCGQVSMFLPQNFPAQHDNYGQMSHHPPRPNGRPPFVLPQGPTSGPGQRFCPPPGVPMVRNGMPYPATPHTMPPVLQQNHQNMQQAVAQGEMSVTPIFPGAQPQEGAQMDFNSTPVLYQNMNSQQQIFQTQTDVNGLYGRQFLMLRYPASYIPQVQLFPTRPMPVQVPGTPQNPMQSFQAQHAVVMNQQMLQQQQATEMRQDTSTPQSHHVAQFIPNMGFTPDSSSYYFSPHANLAQPPPIMSGQQGLSFTSYLPHGPAPVNPSPLQTTMNQGPSKHGMSKNYIMYREDYSRSLQQGAQPSNTSTLGRKEKKTIKIIDPSTNEEVDLSAPTKSDVPGTFQKQVKEIVEQTTSQISLNQTAHNTNTDTDSHEELESIAANSKDRSTPPLYPPSSSSYQGQSIVNQVQESSVDRVQENSGDRPYIQSPQEIFSNSSLHLESDAPPVVSVDAGRSVVEEEKKEDEEEAEEEEEDRSSSIPLSSYREDGSGTDHNGPTLACLTDEPRPELVAEEEQEDEEENDDDDDGNVDDDDDESRKHKRSSSKKSQQRVDELFKPAEGGSLEVLDDKSSKNVPCDANSSADVKEKISENEVEVQELEDAEELKEDVEVAEDRSASRNELQTSSISRTDGELDETGQRDAESTVEEKHFISKSENDITAPLEEAPPAPTNGLLRGRRVYSREFLMNLRDCPEALKKLPTISSDLADIVRPMPYFKRESSVGALNVMAMRPPQQGMMGSFNDFSSLYSRSSSQQNRIQKKSGQKQAFQPLQQRIINVPLNCEIQLHTSEQAWKPSAKGSDGSMDSEETVTLKLYKTTRSILNKLTPQNFDTLLKQIKELPINTENRLAGCMDLVFEKAISEPNFCVAYAKMAQNMNTLKVLSKDSSTEFVSFRKLLLNRCQTEFEKDKMDELELEKRQREIDECESGEKKKILVLEREGTMRKVRRRSLGNIRFIGELFKIKMLTEKIMFDCLTRLMKTDDEDSIECLCWLIRTIGKDLDTPRNKKALDQLFSEIIKKSNSKAVSLRTKFMLQDILELRGNVWVPRRNDNNPKTIEQIHREAEQEEMQRQAMINQSPMLINSFPPPIQMQKSNVDMGGSRSGRYHGGSRVGHQANDEGWMTKGVVGGKGNTSFDHSKLRLSKQTIDASDIKLGPCRNTTWSQGAGSGSSSGGSQFQSGSRHSSQESEKSAVPSSNRFAIMGSLGENYDLGGRPVRQTFKEANSLQRSQYHRMQAEAGYNSLPLRRPNSGSRNASRDSSMSREASNRASPVVMAFGSTPASAASRQPAPPTTGFVKEVGFNKEVFKRKTEGLVDEYFEILDEKEALLSAQELHMTESMMSQFVCIVVNHVIEKSNKELRHAGHLLANLLSNATIDEKSFIKGFEEALTDAPELEIDIPKIWDCYSELFSSILSKSPSFLSIVSRAVLCLKTAGKSGLLMGKCMLRVAECQGTQKCVSMWNEAPVSWSDFTVENLFDFMTNHRLESVSVIACDLLKMMNSKADSDAIFCWIKQHIAPHENKPLFVRSLATAACTASLQVIAGKYDVVDDLFKRHVSLLNRYIDHAPEREAQTLFAVQSLVHSLDHPSNILNRFFHLLYEIELISEDAFHEWKSSSDPAEQTGKGVATTATRAFFQWLQDSVEEEDAS